MLQKVKLALRLKNDSFDTEISDIIDACYDDLARGGCKVNIPMEERVYNSLLVRACILYAKANFGYREDSERNKEAYEYLKMSLALSGGFADGEVS